MKARASETIPKEYSQGRCFQACAIHLCEVWHTSTISLKFLLCIFTPSPYNRILAERQHIFFSVVNFIPYLHSFISLPSLFLFSPPNSSSRHCILTQISQMNFPLTQRTLAVSYFPSEILSLEFRLINFIIVWLSINLYSLTLCIHLSSKAFRSQSLKPRGVKHEI